MVTHNLKGTVKVSHSIAGTVEKAQTVYVKELFFNTYLEFPAVGEADKLYIATDKNSIYRYDTASLSYVCISSSYGEIDTIQSGGIDNE